VILDPQLNIFSFSLLKIKSGQEHGDKNIKITVTQCSEAVQNRQATGTKTGVSLRIQPLKEI